MTEEKRIEPMFMTHMPHMMSQTDGGPSGSGVVPAGAAVGSGAGAAIAEGRERMS